MDVSRCSCSVWCSCAFSWSSLADCVRAKYTQYILRACAVVDLSTGWRACTGVGYTLLSVWSWRHLCSADSLSWNVTFIIINLLQLLVMLSRLRPICLSPQLQELYSDVFGPLHMSRLVCSLHAHKHSHFLLLHYPHRQTDRHSRLAIGTHCLIILRTSHTCLISSHTRRTPRAQPSAKAGHSVSLYIQVL